MKYTRTTEVEALQIVEGKNKEIEDAFSVRVVEMIQPELHSHFITSTEWNFIIPSNVGEWVVRNPDGEFETYTDEEFSKLFEPCI